MRIDEVWERLDARLARMERRQIENHWAVMERFKMAQSDLDALAAEIDQTTTVMEGAMQLIEEIEKKLEESEDDPEELRAFREKLGEKRARLAATITKGTKADGEGGNPQAPIPDPGVGGAPADQPAPTTTPAPEQPPVATGEPANGIPANETVPTPEQPNVDENGNPIGTV